MRRKKKRRFGARAGAAGVLAALLVPALAAAGIALGRRRRGAQGDAGTRGPDAPAPSAEVPTPAAAAAVPVAEERPSADEPAAEEVERQWSCQCGQPYRISGEGLHRIYWLPDATLADPIMDGRCANCGRPLPGEQPGPVEAS